MKYYIIAGEASGDLHASNLIKAIKQKDTQADFRCWGGDLMQQQGAVIVKHYRDLAFMGFAEVLMNLGTILKNLRFCKIDLLSYNPDAVILVDYPGFNLRIAQFLHKNGIRVIYYISPQIWAWKQSRVRIIRKVVDKMLVILPFEKDFYSRHGVEVDFVGHPLLDALQEKPYEPVVKETRRPLVALLPGSRKQEIRAVLPEMLRIIPRFPDVDFAIAAVASVDDAFYEKLTGRHNVRIIHGRTYDLLRQSAAALVTSGTATLETALIGTPEVVCYKGGAISFIIAKQLVKVKYISLVNLIMDRPVVKELIQQELRAGLIEQELSLLLYDAERKAAIMNDYDQLRVKLGGAGASDRAAAVIDAFLKQSPAKTGDF